MIITEDQDDGAAYETRYERFAACPIKSSLFVDRAFLEEMGIYEEVEQAFRVAGWGQFVTFSCETNIHDVCEFLASMEMDQDAGFRYRHRGVYCYADGRDVRNAFGMSSARRAERDTHSNVEAWNVLSGGLRYVSGKSNATDIVEPKFFYLHKLIAHSITGRKVGSQKPSLADMDILRGFLFEKKVPFASIMAQHWESVQPTSDLYVGGLITHFLKVTHGNEPLPFHEIIEPEFLTREKMRTMKGVKIARDNRVTWNYRMVAEPVRMRGDEFMGDDEEQPEPSNRRSRAQTRGQSRGHTGAQAQAQEQEQAQAQAQAQTQLHAHTQGQSDPASSFMQDQRRWMFNTSRVLEFLAPPGSNLSMDPPSYWEPGYPIPAGFHLREQDNDEAAEGFDDDDSDDDDGFGTSPSFMDH